MQPVAGPRLAVDPLQLRQPSVVGIERDERSIRRGEQVERRLGMVVDVRRIGPGCPVPESLIGAGLAIQHEPEEIEVLGDEPGHGHEPAAPVPPAPLLRNRLWRSA